jgi:hypothetical protein
VDPQRAAFHAQRDVVRQRVLDAIASHMQRPATTITAAMSDECLTSRLCVVLAGGVLGNPPTGPAPSVFCIVLSGRASRAPRLDVHPTVGLLPYLFYIGLMTTLLGFFGVRREPLSLSSPK